MPRKNTDKDKKEEQREEEMDGGVSRNNPKKVVKKPGIQGKTGKKSTQPTSTFNMKNLFDALPKDVVGGPSPAAFALAQLQGRRNARQTPGRREKESLHTGPYEHPPESRRETLERRRAEAVAAALAAEADKPVYMEQEATPPTPDDIVYGIMNKAVETQTLRSIEQLDKTKVDEVIQAYDWYMSKYNECIEYISNIIISINGQMVGAEDSYPRYGNRPYLFIASPTSAKVKAFIALGQDVVKAIKDRSPGYVQKATDYIDLLQQFINNLQARRGSVERMKLAFQQSREDSRMDELMHFMNTFTLDNGAGPSSMMTEGGAKKKTAAKKKTEKKEAAPSKKQNNKK